MTRALQKQALYAFVVFLCVVIMAGFFFRARLDTWLQHFVTKQLSQALGGDVEFASIHMQFFPPYLEASDIVATIDQGLVQSIRVDRAKIVPGLGPLFVGDVVIDKIEVIRPTLVIDLMRRPIEPKSAGERSVFRVPAARDLISLKIKSIDVRDVQLSLKLPGENIQVLVDAGVASYVAGGEHERWQWSGAGVIQRGGRQLVIDSVMIDAKRAGRHIWISRFQAKGLGVDVQMRGKLYPEAKINVDLDADADKLVQAWFELGILNKPMVVKGQWASRGRITGVWDQLLWQTQITGRQIAIGKRVINRVDLTLAATRNEIKSLQGNLQQGSMKILVDVKNLARDKPGAFQVSAKELPFEDFQRFLDPDEDADFSGPMNFNVRGQVGFEKKDFHAAYDIEIAKFVPDLDESVRTYLPLTFFSVRTTGQLDFDGSKGWLIENGVLQAKGLEATYSVEIQPKGETKGYWIGRVNSLAGVVESDYPLSGWGHVGGGLSIKDKQIKATVDLQLEQLKYGELPPLQGQGQLVFRKKEFSLRQIELRSGNARVLVDAIFSEADDRKSYLRGGFQSFPLEWIAAIASREYPICATVQGQGDGSIELTQPRLALGGRISLEANDTLWKGTLLDEVSLDVVFKEGRARFNKGLLRGKDFFARLRGAIDRDKYDGFGIKVDRWPTHFFTSSSALVALFPSISGDVGISGNMEDPDTLGHLSVFSPYQDEKESTVFGVAKISGRWSKLVWNLQMDQGRFGARGTITLTGPTRAFEGQGELQRFTLHQHDAQIKAHATGLWRVTGDLRDATSWSGSMSLENLGVGEQGTKLFLERPVSVKMASGQLKPFELSLVDHVGTQLVVGGQLKHELDGYIRGDLSLSQARIVIQGIERAEGVLQTFLRVTGPLTDPVIRGPVRIKGGLIRLDGFPHAFEEVESSGVVDGKMVLIESARAQLGGGLVTVDGSMTIGDTLTTTTLSLFGQAQSVSLRFPQWLPATVSGSVGLKGPIVRPTLYGDLKVDRALYRDEWDWQSSILNLGQVRSVERLSAQTDASLLLDLTFSADDESFQLRNNIAEAQLKGLVKLVGSDLALGLVGRVEVLQGTVEFLDNKFELTSGHVAFERRDKIEPIFDLNARTRVGGTDILLDIRTQNKNVVAFLTSQPIKDENNILALLTLGVDTNEIIMSGGSSGSQFSSSFLPGVLSSPVQSKIQESLKNVRLADTLQFVPYFSEQDQTTGLRMIVGKKLFPKFRLLYSTDLFDLGAENTIRVQQDIGRKISLQGSVRDNQRNANEEIDVGLDFEFRFDF